MRLTRLAAPLLAVALLPACTGQSCDALPALQAERDAEREAYLELTRTGTASEAEITEAHDALHELETRTYDVEQRCDAGRA